uniref:Ig-like domain-containing protein n=1 Tax=Oryzias latipes TaxID=8090 RepID=A0A3P9M6C8_ORYLA
YKSTPLLVTRLAFSSASHVLCGSSLSAGSVGQNVVVTQPAAKSVQLGQKVTIDCKASRQVAVWSGSQYYLSWYHQKSGEAPKALIHRTSDRFSGISSRFSGSGSGNGIDFTLTISGVQAEDSGVYYCQIIAGACVWLPPVCDCVCECVCDWVNGSVTVKRFVLVGRKALYKYTPFTKIFLYTFKAFHNLAPPYLSDLLHISIPARSLRSSSFLSLLPILSPWGAGHSVALLPGFGTHSPLTSATLTHSHISNQS